MTHSQRGEDDIVVPLLPEYGRYLSIGEYDGKTFSNVRLLAEKGWDGVCVEPAAHAFSALTDNPPPNATLVNALVARSTGLHLLHYSKDALSTMMQSHADKWKSITTYTPVYTVGVTLSDLFATCPGPYDLISIDTEGTTAEIVYDLIGYLDVLETKVLIYEFDGHPIEIDGFTEVHRTEENVILSRT